MSSTKNINKPNRSGLNAFQHNAINTTYQAFKQAQFSPSKQGNGNNRNNNSMDFGHKAPRLHEEDTTYGNFTYGGNENQKRFFK